MKKCLKECMMGEKMGNGTHKMGNGTHKMENGTKLDAMVGNMIKISMIFVLNRLISL